MQRKSHLLYLLIIVLTLPSCSRIALIATGMKPPKHLSEKQLQRFSDKMKIPGSNSFYVDSTYTNFLISIDSTKGNVQHHAQPTQALYFQEGKKIHPLGSSTVLLLPLVLIYSGMQRGISMFSLL